MSKVTAFIMGLALAAITCAAPVPTPLPFEDNLSTLDPACVAARPNGDQNNGGCGQFRSIGLNRFGYPTVSLVGGAFQCTYRQIEDECRAQIHFAETDSIYTYFEVTYAADYDFGAGQKIMRWSAYNYAAGLNYSDHIMVSKQGAAVNGLHPMSEIYGEKNNGSGNYGAVSYSMQRGVKYRVKNYLNLRTGVFRLWINDTLRINSVNLTNMRNAGDTHGINMVAFMGWLSGSSPSSPATYTLDNPRVSLVDDFANWPGTPTPPVIPPVVPPVIPPAPSPAADTAYTVRRDTTFYRVIRTTTTRTIATPLPVTYALDSTITISRDTTAVP